MRVLIPNKRGSDWADSKGGKGKYIYRLIPHLRTLGVEVTTDPKDNADVVLYLSKFWPPTDVEKKVLRLGAIHIDIASKWKRLNAENKRAYKKADGIIFQADFSRKQAERFFGKTKAISTVIHNAADPAFYTDIKPYRTEFKRNVLTVARDWLPQKRLKYVVDAFISANVPDCALWVAGDCKPLDTHYNSIKYLGMQDNEQLASLYLMADVLVHIVWIDANPNVVCEALAAGCPVICGANGGVRELLRGHGTVLGLEEPWNYKPVNLQRPPKPNMTLLVNAIKGMTEKRLPRQIKSNIRESAKGYADFLRKIVYG